MNLVKSKERVINHGEVFTPTWMVEAMLDLVQDEAERVDSRFLETACGSGNFIVKILKRKFTTVQLKYGHSEFERKHFALSALMSVYGIELLEDNIHECRANALAIFLDYLQLAENDVFYGAACHVLAHNIVHGDALTMRTVDGEPITFAEWGYLGKGRFQRRDFRLDILTGMAKHTHNASLFDKHEIFTPVKTYPAMTVRDLAEVFLERNVLADLSICSLNTKHAATAAPIA